MSNFAVTVRRIEEPVTDHPNADRLSIIKIGDYLTISGKLEDGSHRYKQGDYVAYIPEAAILPEWLLKRLDFWNEEENKGTLNGPEGNRLKALKLRGIVSQGMLYPCEAWNALDGEYPPEPEKIVPRKEPTGAWNWSLTINSDGTLHRVLEGDDVAEILGIVKWEPPIPVHMAGQVLNVFGHTMHYDFENWQNHPDIFDPTDEVVATEKLHGTFCQIVFSQMVDEELFGDGKNIIVTSKGVGSKGLAFKNVPENDGNLYVRALNKLLDAGLETSVNSLKRGMEHLLQEIGKVPASLDTSSTETVHIFGEIFGGSVQDLKYGLKEPDFRVFEIAVNGKFLNDTQFLKVATLLGLKTVPELYRGPFDEAVLKTVRDGKTTFGEANIREGIVIRTTTEQTHVIYGRKIAKMVSPAYLLRKGDVTEYN